MSKIATIIVTALIGIATVGAQAAADAANKPISIPAGDLEKALQTLVRATGAQLMYEQKQVEGVRTRGVEDAKSTAAAVAALLEGTALKSRVDVSGAIFIVAVGKEGSAAVGSPADQMRLAAKMTGKGKGGSESGHGDAIDKADVVVQDRRIEPYQDANVDIPRTINDAQPYYIFNAEVIQRSGATSIEDFLKQRLTMNAAAQTNGQSSFNGQYDGPRTLALGNTSSVNLRGLGADKTLILVNGRRMPSVTNSLVDSSMQSTQPDLNGIPLSAVDRIEVLPTSASGIYGGSAVGGVVNVILKEDYSGGEIRATYDGVWDADAPTRRLSASYGLALEGGKTHVMLNASWSDAESLLLQDRRALFEQNLDEILENSPAFIYASSGTDAFLGSLPNIVPNSPTGTLALKDGGELGTRYAYIPAGISPSTSMADLSAALANNAGSWNLDLPASSQAPTGLLRPFGSTPSTRSFLASVRRRMSPGVEAFVDVSYNENRTESIFNYGGNPGILIVPSWSPVNPFSVHVRLRAPDASRVPTKTRSVARSITAGAIISLPWGWTGEVDYSMSVNEFDFSYRNIDITAKFNDLSSGALNPFVDTLLYPLDLEQYQVPGYYESATEVNDFALRGSGPLFSFPWGVVDLTLGLQHRIIDIPENTWEEVYPLSPGNSYVATYFGRRQVTDSGYGELTIPLLENDPSGLSHALELQLSGRMERYEVDTGTSAAAYYPNLGATFFLGPTLNGEPYSSKARYTSTNGTVGIKYQPSSAVTLRASLASAFLPPTPDQLIKNPMPGTTQVVDSVTGQTNVLIGVLSGGNPDLKPQSSESFNAGIIWEPQRKALRGLRFNVEYYKIEQDGYIASLAAQQIVNLEDVYPGRVSRDASGTITQVDASALNLYGRETEGFDLSMDYGLETDAGAFYLRALGSAILHLKNQYSQSSPAYDGVDFPSEGGAAKYKANAVLTWERKAWTTSWSARYFGSYRQYGAPGSPSAVQRGIYDYFTTAQGGETIPSQIYHDLYVSYDFGSRHSSTGSQAAGAHGGSGISALGSALLDGLVVQGGVRNVFDQAPPLDAFYLGNYYLSPYGDTRLRSYWLSVRKAFH